MCCLGNLQKRDIGARISPVQFLRDRELGIRGEKHGTVIREPVSEGSLLARQKVYYETNVTRTMNMKRGIGGVEMSM